LFASAQNGAVTGDNFRAMAADTVYTRTVRRAVQDVGGVEQLATLLKVSTSEIESWMSGKTSPSNAHFLQMLDVVATGPPR
jgi:DNA-binding transcriptional regulator YiaG